MAITDLTNTTWHIPSGWTAEAGYGQFWVYFYTPKVIPEQDGFWIGYGGQYYEQANTIWAWDFGDTYSNNEDLTVTFTHGTDISNPDLIAWLEANGELQVEEPKVIKAGTYRFNDVLSVPDTPVSAVIPFEVPPFTGEWTQELSDRLLAEDGIYIPAGTYTVTYSYSGMVWYLPNEHYPQNPFLDYRDQIAKVVPYNADAERLLSGTATEFYVVGGGWSSDIGEDNQTITVTEDAEVSEGFYNWFIANVQRIIKKGTYRFNDVLTVPDSILLFEGSFTVKSVVNYDKYIYDFEALRAGRYSYESGYIATVDYNKTSALDEGSIVYDGAWRVDVFGDGIKTIIVNEDIEVSEEHYTWFTENANPVIKAGTYRFNDIIVDSPSDHTPLFQDINFKATLTFEGGTFTEKGVAIETYNHPTDGIIIYFYTRFEEHNRDGATVYSLGKWTDVFGEGIKTITIPEDTEVSAEFSEWFTANANPLVIKAGRYKFNDTLTQGNFGTQYLNFTFTANFPKETETGAYILEPKTAFGNEIYQEDTGSVSYAYRFADGKLEGAYFYHSKDGHWGNEAYTEEELRAALEAGYISQGMFDLYMKYGMNVYGEGIKTITLETDQTVSAEFYEWFIENAKKEKKVIKHTVQQMPYSEVIKKLKKTAEAVNQSKVEAIAEANSYTDNSKSEAISEANSYTDERKSEAISEAISGANRYTDTVKDNLLNGAGSAYDTLKELADLIVNNRTALDALREIASGKANAVHNHSASDINSGALSTDRLPVVPISKGGTGSTSASGAISALGAVPTTRRINGTQLTSDINLNASSVGADAMGSANRALSDAKKYADELKQDAINEAGSYTNRRINEAASDVSGLLGGKVDKTTEPYTLYGTNGNGEQTVHSIANNPKSSAIVRYTNNAGGIYTLRTNDALHDLDCVNKRSFERVVNPLTEKQTALEERVADLESLTLTFTEDTETAYEKIVPASVGKYALIKSFGGATYRGKNILDPHILPNYNWIQGFGVNDDGSFTVWTEAGEYGEYAYISIVLPQIGFDYGRYYAYVSVDVETHYEISKSNDYFDIMIYPKEVNGTYEDVKATVKVMLWRDPDVTIEEGYEILDAPEGTVFEPYGSELLHAKVERIESIGANLFDGSLINCKTEAGITVQYDSETQIFTINGKAGKSYNYSQTYINLKGEKGKKYVLKTEIVGGTIDSPDDVAVAYFGSSDTPNKITNWRAPSLLLTSDYRVATLPHEYITAFWFYLTEGSTLYNLQVKIMLARADSDVPYKPHKSEPIDTITIPEAVRNKEGYGREGSYIEWVDDRVILRVTKDENLEALAKPIVTDITDLFTGDNSIEVEGGGTIRFVNENELSVPNTIGYVTRKG